MTTYSVQDVRFESQIKRFISDGCHKKAMFMLEKAIAECSKHGDCLKWKRKLAGLELLYGNNLEKALCLVEQCLEIKEDVFSMMLKGKILVALFRYEEAFSLFRQVLKMANSFLKENEAKFWMAKIYYKKEDLEKAVKILEGCSHDFASINFLHGQLLFEQNALDRKSLDLFAKACLINKEIIIYHWYFARAAFVQNEMVLASKHFHEVLSIYKHGDFIKDQCGPLIFFDVACFYLAQGKEVNEIIYFLNQAMNYYSHDQYPIIAKMKDAVNTFDQDWWDQSQTKYWLWSPIQVGKFGMDNDFAFKNNEFMLKEFCRRNNWEQLMEIPHGEEEGTLVQWKIQIFEPENRLFTWISEVKNTKEEAYRNLLSILAKNKKKEYRKLLSNSVKNKNI